MGAGSQREGTIKGGLAWREVTRNRVEKGRRFPCSRLMKVIANESPSHIAVAKGGGMASPYHWIARRTEVCDDQS